MAKKKSTEKKAKFTKNKIFLIFIVVVVAFAMLGLQACNKNKGDSGSNGDDGDDGPSDNYESNYTEPTDVTNINKYTNVTTVGYSAEYLGTVDRQKPAVSDGGLVANGTIKSYPKWGSTLNLNAEQKTALINESSWTLCSVNTTIGSDGKPKNTFDRMDAEGNLYLNGVPVQDGQKSGKGMQVPKKLYKHTAANAMYGGGLSDSEPALIKRVSLKPRGYSSYSVTGLYAPAGEVIKIQMSGADMNATGGITVHIGQALYNAKANNIWVQRGINRMPTILQTWVITKTTATYDEETDTWTGYVGSFLGGPIYVRNTSANVDLTITGGVAYSHFILGYTTPEEFEQCSKSTAPYFDLEVWYRGVLHSGPKSYAKRFSYDELYDAAVLWEKISLVANSVSGQGGIVFIYDCFVAAGAAVAFPGQKSVNCPASWMPGSLNYNSFISGGSWGNMHEYHHNFQNYGVGDRGEVTNNALNIVAYSLFTKISSKRGIGSYGSAGLGGWNNYTSAPWTLMRVNTGAIKSTNGLAVYATLLHNFGQNAFISAKGSGTNYFKNWQSVTHQNFSYYVSKVSSYTGAVAPTDNTNYPMFVPVASVYQTGRTYMYDSQKREINTMQPYIISSGKDFTVDLRPYTVNNAGQYESGSVVIGSGFNYKIKSVDASKASGTLTPTDVEGVYTFKPGSEDYSGKIYVTLEITASNGEKTYNGCRLDDVDLILEFQQSRESTRSTLERTTYTYAIDGGYADAEAAFQNNFAGSTSVKEKYDHSNPTQNANTDIWYVGTVNGKGNPNNTSGKKDFQIISPADNRIEVIDGKLYFSEDGKYRVYLRGRSNCALYYSIDGSNYTVGATIKDAGFTPSSVNNIFRLNDSNTYFDIQFTTQEDGLKRTVTVFNDEDDDVGKVLTTSFTGDRWLYIKEVLIAKPLLSDDGKGITSTPYIGVGMAEWTEPMCTIQYSYFDASGNSITDPEDPNIDPSKTITKYYKNGVEVSAEEAEDTSLIPPSKTTQPSYVNAYRNNYEIQKQFTSDYFILPSYNYGFDNTVNVSNGKASIVSSNYDGDSGYAIANVIDGNTGANSNFHTTFDTAKGALELVVDLGEEVTANHVTVKGLNNSGNKNGNDNRGIPTTFKLLVSTDGVNFEEVVSREKMAVTALDNTFDFDVKTFRYYKYIVSEAASKTKKVAFNEIQFYYNTLTISKSSNFYSLDKSLFTFRGEWKVQAANSTFGHVYIGKNGAELKFKFTGTYLAILSSKNYGSDFEVYIDGKKVDSLLLKKDNSPYSVSYMSQELSGGEHSVVITCLTQASFDSIVTYDTSK